MKDALDHAKHIRATHFSLIVATAAVLMAITFATDKHEQALKETEAIEHLSSNSINDVRDFVRSLVNITVAQHPRATELKRFSDLMTPDRSTPSTLQREYILRTNQMLSPFDFLFRGIRYTGTKKEIGISVTRDDQIPIQETELAELEEIATSLWHKPETNPMRPLIPIVFYEYDELIYLNNWGSSVGLFDSLPDSEQRTHLYNITEIDYIETLGHFKDTWNALADLREYRAISGFETTSISPGGTNNLVQGFVRWTNEGTIRPETNPTEEECRYLIGEWKPILLRHPPSSNDPGFKDPAYSDLSNTPDFYGAYIRPRVPSSCGPDSYAEDLAITIPFEGAHLEELAPDSFKLDTIENTQVKVNVKAIRILVDGQKYALDSFLKSFEGSFIPKRGTFEQSFPEVTALINEFSDVQLERLSVDGNVIPGTSNFAQFIRKISELSSRQLSLFGLAITSNILMTWGSLILAGISFYLALHLRAFTRAHSKADVKDIPWIGLYVDDKYAKFAVLVTTVIFPISVSTYLAIRTFRTSGSTQFYEFISTALTFAAALILYRTLMLLWNELKLRSHNV